MKAGLQAQVGEAEQVVDHLKQALRIDLKQGMLVPAPRNLAG